MRALIIVALVLSHFALCATHADTLDLAGEWRLQLDPDDAGLREHWPGAPLDATHRIQLPGTTDLAGIGFPLDTNTMLHAVPFPVTTRFPGVKEPERADEHGYLVRRHLFVGPAWYERDIEVPPSWEGKPVALRIERALWKTEAWLDGRSVGSCDSLAAEHRHDLGTLTPGTHRLTIRVDNRLIHNLSTVTHAYGPETQSRWNGMIGSLCLEASRPISIRSLAVFPQPDRRSVRLVVRVANMTDVSSPESAEFRLFPESGDAVLSAARVEFKCEPGLTDHEHTLQLAEPAAAWDEFHPVRHRIEATLSSSDRAVAHFGFRTVERVGKEMRLNGRRLFLRGTLDCAVYPKTGHPPMTVPEWERVWGVVKEYGFNHVRFHTWCPPRAAFEAADRLGLYLQPETAAWVDDWGTTTVTKPPAIGRDPQITDFLRAELRRISEAYGNHPSFLLCAIGNEFGMRSTDWERVNAMVREIKTLDPRRLYTGCGARKNLPEDDFWFTHQTGAGTRGVGPGRTDWDFGAAANSSPVPLIAHETGQRPVFPDFAALLPKFTGPLLPLNYARYWRSLTTNGLAGQMREFVRASARFQLTQYKAEHEAMLRTSGYTGYQLLMLNDFTGQSEALVGILDPFWESKGVVSPEEVRTWNAPTVALARFKKFVWTADEVFHADLEVAHFGDTPLPAGTLRWELNEAGGRTHARGRLETLAIPVAGLRPLGPITASLASLTRPTQLQLHVEVAGVENHWPIWVYPPAGTEPEPAEVLVTRTLDDAALQTLESGGKVLLLAHGTKSPFAAQTGFESVYWSAGWWGNRFSALGVLCDPGHPALEAFPNQGFSDWQWRDLCAGATTFDLSGAPAGFRPLVQPVPDFHFNTLLGHVFEAKVDKGALLVCGYDLETNLDHRPAARQFRQSLFRYAGSERFRPAVELPRALIEKLVGQAAVTKP